VRVLWPTPRAAWRLPHDFGCPTRRARRRSDGAQLGSGSVESNDERSDSASMWLIRNADVANIRVDCRIRAGRIAELRPGLEPGPSDIVLDAHGGSLLPGLADHHIHLFALAAAAQSIDLRGSPRLDVAASAGGLGWLRVVGAGRELHRAELDDIWPDRPVRVQHRSGALWTLNSRALDLIGAEETADERANGQFWRADERLGRRLRIAGASQPIDLAELGTRLAAWGITHVTDATPDLDHATASRLADGVPQRVLSLGDPEGAGPLKIVVADHELPNFDLLMSRVRKIHEAGRAVAVHAVTETALALCIAVLSDVGVLPGDRIEHAASCSDSAARALADLGVVVVTQPSVLTRHGVAFVRDSTAAERDVLWRYAGLTRLGVRVAASSDAPYGDPNPWQSIQAAALRQLADGTMAGPQERVPGRTALESMLAPPGDPGGPPRRVAVGEPADLCLLEQHVGEALDAALRGDLVHVRATFVDGHRIAGDR
jgi:predicted amidohydrolase YtcJ